MDDLLNAVRASAGRLGIDPVDLLTTMSYETGGRLDPNLWGGKGGQHLGLIQFGKEERAKYGVAPGMAIADQVLAAENYLRDRGLKPGMGLLDVYSTINAGRPGLYSRSDAMHGGAPGTVADKVKSENMMRHRLKAQMLLDGKLPPSFTTPVGQRAPAPTQVASADAAAPMSLAPPDETAAAEQAQLIAMVQRAAAQAEEEARIKPVRPIKIDFPTPANVRRHLMRSARV